jgi:hypothetical protein
MIPRGTNPLIGSYVDSCFLCMSQFTLPMVTTDYLCGMPTTKMAGLQTNASTYVDNATTAFSPYNTHLASGSALSILVRNGQPSITTYSLMSLRQQIDKSNLSCEPSQKP